MLLHTVVVFLSSTFKIAWVHTEILSIKLYLSALQEEADQFALEDIKKREAQNDFLHSTKYKYKDSHTVQYNLFDFVICTVHTKTGETLQDIVSLYITFLLCV